MRSFAALAAMAVVAFAAPAFAKSPAEAEATLRATITGLQTDSADYDSMDPRLVEAIRNAASSIEQLKALGPVTVVTSTSDADPFTFDVTFQNEVTLHWTLSFDDAGKIDGLNVTE